MTILCYTDLTCTMEGGVFLSPYWLFLLIALPLRYLEVKVSARVKTPHRMPRIHRSKRICTLALSFLAFVFFCMHIYGFGPFSNWIIAFSALMHSIAYYSSYKLLKIEYHRYLPQTWIGSRGLWFFGGIEGVGRILFYTTISDFDFMILYCREARPARIKHLSAQFHQWLSSGYMQMISTNSVTSDKEVTQFAEESRLTQPSGKEVTQFAEESAEESRFLHDKGEVGSRFHASWSPAAEWPTPMGTEVDSANAFLPMQTLAKRKKNHKSQQNENEKVEEHQNENEDGKGADGNSQQKERDQDDSVRETQQDDDSTSSNSDGSTQPSDEGVSNNENSLEEPPTKKSEKQSKKNKANADETAAADQETEGSTSESSSTGNSQNATSSSNEPTPSSTASLGSEAFDDTSSNSSTSDDSSPEADSAPSNSTSRDNVAASAGEPENRRATSSPQTTAAKKGEGPRKEEQEYKNFIPHYREVAFIHLLYELLAFLFGAFQIILMYLSFQPHDLSVELLGVVQSLLAPDEEDQEAKFIRDINNTLTSIGEFNTMKKDEPVRTFNVVSPNPSYNIGAYRRNLLRPDTVSGPGGSGHVSGIYSRNSTGGATTPIARDLYPRFQLFAPSSSFALGKGPLGSGGPLGGGDNSRRDSRRASLPLGSGMGGLGMSAQEAKSTNQQLGGTVNRDFGIRDIGAAKEGPFTDIFGSVFRSLVRVTYRYLPSDLLKKWNEQVQYPALEKLAARKAATSQENSPRSLSLEDGTQGIFDFCLHRCILKTANRTELMEIAIENAVVADAQNCEYRVSVDVHYNILKGIAINLMASLKSASLIGPNSTATGALPPQGTQDVRDRGVTFNNTGGSQSNGRAGNTVVSPTSAGNRILIADGLDGVSMAIIDAAHVMLEEETFMERTSWCISKKLKDFQLLKTSLHHWFPVSSYPELSVRMPSLGSIFETESRVESRVAERNPKFQTRERNMETRESEESQFSDRNSNIDPSTQSTSKHTSKDTNRDRSLGSSVRKRQLQSREASMSPKTEDEDELMRLVEIQRYVLDCWLQQVCALDCFLGSAPVSEFLRLKENNTLLHAILLRVGLISAKLWYKDPVATDRQLDDSLSDSLTHSVPQIIITRPSPIDSSRDDDHERNRELLSINNLTVTSGEIIQANSRDGSAFSSNSSSQQLALPVVAEDLTSGLRRLAYGEYYVSIPNYELIPGTLWAKGYVAYHVKVTVYGGEGLLMSPSSTSDFLAMSGSAFSNADPAGGSTGAGVGASQVILVKRRYREFVKFDAELRAELSTDLKVQIPRLPAKMMSVLVKDYSFYKRRKADLELWFRSVAKVSETWNTQAMKDFLQPDPDDGESDEDQQLGRANSVYSPQPEAYSPLRSVLEVAKRALERSGISGITGSKEKDDSQPPDSRRGMFNSPRYSLKKETPSKRGSLQDSSRRGSLQDSSRRGSLQVPSKRGSLQDFGKRDPLRDAENAIDGYNISMETSDLNLASLISGTCNGVTGSGSGSKQNVGMRGDHHSNDEMADDRMQSDRWPEKPATRVDVSNIRAAVVSFQELNAQQDDFPNKTPDPSFPSTFISYQITVQRLGFAPNFDEVVMSEWTIFHRFRDFVALKDDLEKYAGKSVCNIVLPSLPTKIHFLSDPSPAERMLALDAFLREVLKEGTRFRECQELADFLGVEEDE